MEKVAGHTATPWEYSGGGIWGKSPLNARVRLADMVFHNSINRISSEANAAFIVQAVNAHDELVAALKLARDFIIQDCNSFFRAITVDGDIRTAEPEDVEALEEYDIPLGAIESALSRATKQEG